MSKHGMGVTHSGAHCWLHLNHSKMNCHLTLTVLSLNANDWVLNEFTKCQSQEAVGWDLSLLCTLLKFVWFVEDLYKWYSFFSPCQTFWPFRYTCVVIIGRNVWYFQALPYLEKSYKVKGLFLPDMFILEHWMSIWGAWLLLFFISYFLILIWCDRLL